MSLIVPNSGSNIANLTKTVNGRWSEKLTSFKLEFDNDSSPNPGVFLSGTSLRGTIVLDVCKPMTIIRIYFKCEGILRIEDMRRDLMKETRILQGQEKGRKAGNKTAPGRYKYPICVNLSDDLPTTISQSSNCKVEYKCTVGIIRKTSADDITIIRPFVVHQKNAKLLHLVASNQTKQTSEISVSGLTIQVSIGKAGYFPGQKVEITGNIVNDTNSSKKVKVGVELIRTVKGFGETSMVLFSYSKYKTYVTTVATRWTDYIKAAKNQNTPFVQEFTLVHLEPSSKTDILEIEYSVNVISIVSGVFGDGAPKSCSFPIYLAPNLTSLATEPLPTPNPSLIHQSSQSSGIGAAPIYPPTGPAYTPAVPMLTQQTGQGLSLAYPAAVPPQGTPGAAASATPSAPTLEELPPSYDDIDWEAEQGKA